MNEPKGKEFAYGGLCVNGFLMLFIDLVLIVFGGWLIATFIDDSVALLVVGVLLVILGLGLISTGFLMLEPNQACVMIFFGKYKGTFAQPGYYWINPFMTKKKLSLRIDNLDIEPIKVNDREGNPVMIGMVLVWRLNDTYKAMFDVDGANGNMYIYQNFVKIQGNAALREVAGCYAYDNDGHSSEMTLRGGGKEINELLESKINDRLRMAGIEVVEARINYLAYAPEIAAVMLRRQQAAAIIAAREKIVEGAVSTVKMALDHLSNEGVVDLDNNLRAKIIGNLLVVLCADEAAQPVIPTTE